MANVPVTYAPTTEPSQNPGNDYQSVQASPAAFGGITAQGLTQVGAAADRLGSIWGQVQTDNQLAGAMKQADDAVTSFKGLRSQDALDQQDSVNKTLDTIGDQARSQLTTLEQQHQFDQNWRPYRDRYLAGQISTHATQQGYETANSVIQTSLTNALTGVANVAEDPDHVEMFRHDVINSLQKQLYLEGNEGNPDAVQAAMSKANQLTYKTQAEALAVKNPAIALQIVEQHKDDLGTAYAPLADQLRSRAAQDLGVSVAQQAISGATTNMANGTPQNSAPIKAAILTQESGNSNAAPTSINGAIGPGQIMPDTFARYAKPGESISNPDDNRAVSARIIDDLSQKFGNDPARVAVGYFSGQNNVAPAGNITPWINDTKDGTGKSVSSYVADITSRMNSPGIALKAGAYSQVMDQLQGNPQAQRAALSYINEQASAASVAAMADTKAKKDASDRAMNGYVSDTLSGKAPDMSKIANDPDLDWENKERLSNIVQSHMKDSVDGNTASYGPGFWNAFRGISAPDGDPSRVTDQQQLLQRTGPGGDLTLEGYKQLSDVLQKAQKPEGVADKTMQDYALNYVKHQLSFEADYGFTKIRDPAGEDAFLIGFTPAFFKYYNGGIAAGKSPQELLARDKIDALAAPFKRTPAQLTSDSIQAGVEAPAQAAVPSIPPSLPQGSQYSPSRQMWRDPQGKLYNAQGQPQ